MRHRSLLFRNRRVSLLPLRGFGLWRLLLGGRPAALALRRLLRRGNRHLLRGRPTGSRTLRITLRRRNARGQQRRHASDEKPVSPHFALLLSMESESRATSCVRTALRPFPRSTFWTNNGTSAFHSMLSAPRISRARNTLIEPMPRGCYLPPCRCIAARSISGQEIIVGARWPAPRRELQRSERVLNWDFRKCCWEPQAHEIWSRRLSRVELRPRRLPAPGAFEPRSFCARTGFNRGKPSNKKVWASTSANGERSIIRRTRWCWAGWPEAGRPAAACPGAACPGTGWPEAASLAAARLDAGEMETG